jgi:hypothetical protein
MSGDGAQGGLHTVAFPMTDPAAAPSSRARSIGWFGVVGIVVKVLGVPAFLDQGAPQRRPFNERPLRVLEKARPRGVLVGDSMLGSRIVSEALNALAGERWEVLSCQC